MKIKEVSLKNFGPFEKLENLKINQFSVIIGKNDSGKSNILKALDCFFNENSIDSSYIYDKAKNGDEVVISISFSVKNHLIKGKDDEDISLSDENVLNSAELLEIKNTYEITNEEKIKPNISLTVMDFEDGFYQNLYNTSNSELKKKLKSKTDELNRTLPSDYTSFNDRELRNEIRKIAIEEKCKKVEQSLELGSKDKWKTIIKNNLPKFEIFQSESSTEVEKSVFQNAFKEVILGAIEEENLSEQKKLFSECIESSINAEFSKIEKIFQHHNNELCSIKPKLDIKWEKAIKIGVEESDSSGITKELNLRGSGTRRIFMVSFFQYLAERNISKNSNFIFALEEPENSLHPTLQREMSDSLNTIANKGQQIIITSHSPVFAGKANIKDLSLIQRIKGKAKSIQYPLLDLELISKELGIEPSDQVYGFNGCIFVEGPDDIYFLETICEILKKNGKIKQNFKDKNICIIPFGGDNLIHWVSRKFLKKLHKNYAILVDSDLKSKDQTLPQRKLRWKKEIEDEGALFIILKKREIENYLHPNVIKSKDYPDPNYNDYTDMKKEFGSNVIKKLEKMSLSQILEMDKYIDNGKEYHETLEIIESLLKITDNSKDNALSGKEEKKNTKKGTLDMIFK